MPRTGSNIDDLIHSASASSSNSSARFCCTGWCAKRAAHTSEIAPYQAAPASNGRGRCQKLMPLAARCSRPMAV